MSEELDADEVTALMADLRSRPADVFGPLLQATSQQLAVELLREHLMISAAMAAVILDQPIKHLLPAAQGPVTQSADDADRFTNWTRRDIARIYGVPSDRVRAWARRTGFPGPVGREGSQNIYFAGDVRAWIAHERPID